LAAIRLRSFEAGLRAFEIGTRIGKRISSPSRGPAVVTFHEPHGKDPLREGTLREYLRKLKLSREEFLDLLEGC
jgi:hypothetical protein